MQRPRVENASRTALAAPVSRIVLLLFLASGFSGLVYQVVWTRELTLVFGVTTYATSAVLSSFFAGLALGSWLAGRIADERRTGLRLYGAIEIGIGVYALLVPALLGGLNGVYRFAYREMGASFYVLSLLRFVMSGLVLLIPTTLMGATLPVMTRALVRRFDRLGFGLAGLYALNTLGAAIGVAVAGFVLIGAIGLRQTTWVAAAVNLAIGATAILLGRRGAGAGRDEETAAARAEAARAEVAARAAAPQPAAHARQASYPASVIRLVVLALGLSGVASLGYEVIWTRILAIFLSASGSTFAAKLLGEFSTYAFSAMLCSVLLGIVIGSFWIAPRLDRLRNPVATLALLELSICVATLLAALTIGALLPGRGELFILATSFFILLVPNAILGATVPLAGKIHTRSLATLGRGIGDVYSANVLGGVIGSFLAGFVLIPLLGSQATLILLALLNLGIGVMLARASGVLRATRALVPVAVGVLLAIVLFARPGMLLHGIWKTALPHHSVIFNKEGAEGMVTVTERKEGPDSYYFLLINGRLQSSDEQIGLFIHRQLGHIPLLFHPDPEKMLIIGLGSGSTAGGAARYPMVERLDVVELVPGVIEASHKFWETNYEVWRDPRVHMIVGDGRNYLLVSDEKYDVIEADIIPPRHAMATNLYSADYFRLIKSHLKPGGMVCQWFDTSLPPPLYKMLVRTFLDVFPNTTIWQGGMFAVSFPDGMAVDETLRQRVRDRFADPRLIQPLHEAGLPSAEEFLSTYWKDPQEAKQYVGPGEIVTDDRPYVEFFHSTVKGPVLPTHIAPGWR